MRLPSRRRTTSPASSSTRRCFEIAGSDIWNGRASTEGSDSPRASSARIARRVGSASAANVASSVSDE